MPRGKNYVNNNRGVRLQAPRKGNNATKSMIQCQYGLGCTRPDCVYRHDGGGGSGTGSTSEENTICLPYLAGMCTFTNQGCRRRHPTDPKVVARIKAKYKKTRCRFGDECRTEGCLYLHPSEVQQMEPNYVTPLPPSSMTNDFPALGGGQCLPVPPGQLPSQPYVPNSAWKPTPPTTMIQPTTSLMRAAASIREDTMPSASLNPLSTMTTTNPVSSVAPSTWAPASSVPTNPWSVPAAQPQIPSSVEPHYQVWQQPSPSSSQQQEAATAGDNAPRTSGNFNVNAKEFVPSWTS